VRAVLGVGAVPSSHLLHAALKQAGLDAEPEPMPDKGLAHSHFRLPGTGLVARIPKQSQMRLAPGENLAYQAACYARASLSDHAPRLDRILPPSAALPRGGLVVEEIRGRPARLPDDLDAIVIALAAIHALPLPAERERPPLSAPADPLADLIAEIEAQATFLEAARVAPASRAIIETGLAGLRALARRPERPPRRLISFDAHPGNFLIEASGRAVLVDLEKCRYGAPQLDLAHATLYTSTTWDLESHAVLAVEEVARACRHWLDRVAEVIRPAGAAAAWLLPLRRAMWLWSLTWCAKWRVLSDRAPAADATGEDWSSGRSDAALVAHVRSRVDHYLDPEIATAVDLEFHSLASQIW
jgi:hypothetical protein